MCRVYEEGDMDLVREMISGPFDISGLAAAQWPLLAPGPSSRPGITTVLDRRLTQRDICQCCHLFGHGQFHD